ncbi:MAG: S-layer homology domain-containing protein, partial [Oscillospiraceae bacterium]|nr:S-layer homology domain-containing protein [Oscillospiraceae bacterium]
MKTGTVRRSLTMLLILVLLCGTVPTVLAADGALSNFQKVNKYTKGQFNDVKTGDWYYESVKAGYEYGLVKGTSESTYSPDNNITIAQSITLAARLHSIFNTGSESFVQGSPWYQVYVDYAVKNRIIGANEYSNYDAKATRAQF